MSAVLSRLDLTWAVFGEVKHIVLDTEQYVLRACEVLLCKQLRTLCYANGREKDKEQSAEILRQLAVVYRLKSPNKLSLIQSCALFNAAAAREADNLEEIAKNLRELCTHVLMLARARNADLVTKTDVFYDMVERMRSDVEKELENLTEISDNVSKDERKNMEAMRVEQIRKIQTFVTEEYLNVMKEIMTCCIDIKGPPPCMYALVGMGSLARNEITPYSDFENVILLEEGVQHRPDYEEILEYFRWVAVIFQLILVNFGETIVRFLNIEGLNDPYKKDDDWFYDQYTTCGISPDGFAPHASKNPLGRPKTKQKPWETELIKPISGMLKYLETEEDLKNGYHLADILLKTCFVQGNDTVYHEFRKGVKHFQSRTQDLSLFRKQHEEDLDNFELMTRLSSINFRQRFDMKRTIFRIVTIFIASLGRYHQLNSTSSLDIIQELEENSIIDKEFGSSLKYAVAVACEIRLKVYMENRAQADQLFWNSSENDIKNLGVVEAVGIGSLVSLFHTAENLQYFFDDTVLKSMAPDQDEARRKSSINPNRVGNIKPTVCMTFGLYEKTIEECHKHLMTHPPSKQRQWFEVLMVHSLYRLKRYEDANENCKSLLSETDDLRQLLLCISGESLLNLGRYKEGLAQLEIALSLFEDDNLVDILKADCLFRMGECLFRLDQFTSAMHYFESARSIYVQAGIEDTVVHCLDMKGKSLFNLGLIEIALRTFCDLLNEQRRLTEDETMDCDVAETLDLIYLCLIQLDRLKEAFVYKEEELDIHENILEELEDISNELTTVDQIVACKIAVADCLVKLGRNDDSIECRNDAVQDLEMTLNVKELPDAEKLPYLKLLRQCYVHLKQDEKVVEIFEQEIQCDLAVNNAETDLDLAECYHLYGLFLVKIDKKTKGFGMFESELKILNDLTENSCNKSITLQKKAHCLLSQEKYISASELFMEQLTLEEKKSSNGNLPFWSLVTTSKLADCYRNIAYCLDMSTNYKEALTYYNLELGMRRHLAESSGTSLPVADCFLQIGFCYFKMNCVQDALDTFVQCSKISMDSACSTMASSICFLSQFGQGKCLREQGNYEEVVNICILALKSLVKSWQNPTEKLLLNEWLGHIDNNKSLATKRKCFEEHKSIVERLEKTNYYRLSECIQLIGTLLLETKTITN